MIWSPSGQVIWDGYYLIYNTLQMMANDYTDILNIAENIRWLEDFDSYWDTDFAGTLIGTMSEGEDSNRDMDAVAAVIAPGVPIARRVLYTESHDTAGDLNGGKRLPTAIHGTDPEGYWARKRSALGAAIAFTAQGIPMLLQGQEMLETNSFGDQRVLDWRKTNTHARVTRLYRDLAALRKNTLGLSGGLTGDDCDMFHIDNTNKLIAYRRWNPSLPGQDMVIAAHFANAQRTAYPLAFPHEGTWFVHFNSDSTNYSSDYGNFGSAQVVATGQPATASIDIGPYSALILSQIPRGLVLDRTETNGITGGNGDAFIDPGEIVSVRVTLRNTGADPATNTVAILTSANPLLTILQASTDFPIIAPGSTGVSQNVLQLHLSRRFPCGSEATLPLIAMDNGVATTNLLTLNIGRTVDQPPATNVFESADVPVTILDRKSVYSQLSIHVPVETFLSDLNVEFHAIHSWDSDVEIALQHPDGTDVKLCSFRGGSGDHFGTGTCGAAGAMIFDQEAANAISSGTAPFAGAYRPEESLFAFNGKPLNGTWKLRMTDRYSQDQGTALCWRIQAVAYAQACECSVSNHPPQASSDALSVLNYSPTSMILQAVDADDDPIVFLIASNPFHGRVTGPDSFSNVQYQAVFGFSGADTFAVAAADFLATGDEAQVSVQVVPPADTDSDGLPDAWEELYFSNSLAADPSADPDEDGAPNSDEYRAQTHPHHPQSHFAVEGIDVANRDRIAIRWTAAGGGRYRIESSDGGSGSFLPIERPLSDEMGTGVVGSAGQMIYTDTTPPASGPRIFRARVMNE